MSNITRRNLIKGAALGAAATGMVSTVALADEPQFDAEYDVVVLGMGGTGMNAAIAAYEEGAKVLLVEKAPEGQEPCNTKVAGQVILSTDDPEPFYTYLTALMGKYTNYDLECLHAYAEGAAENFSWMVDVLGGDPDLIYPDFTCPWSTPFHYDEHDSFWGIDRKGHVMVWDEFPEFEGHDHSIVLSFSGLEFDSSYYLTMRDNIAKRQGDNLEVWLGAPGKKLITDGSGAVVGAEIEKDGAIVRVKANGGVVLATGGFESNSNLLATYTQIPYLYPRAAAMSTGDGIIMAQRIGAQIWHMSNISGLGFGFHRDGVVGASTLNSAATTAGVIVGPAGERYFNEKGSSRHGRMSFGGDWRMTPVTCPCYLILDSKGIQNPIVAGFSDANADEIAEGIILQGATIDELCEAVRAKGAAPHFGENGELQVALDRFNAHCAAGEADDFGRTAEGPIEEGPFYAIELCPTMLNTQGGPRHNGKAQVLDWDNMPIEGLFEGGELGSIFPDMYNGGGNLGETMVFGRIAGRNAAKRAKGEFEGATEPAVLVYESNQAAAAEATAAIKAEQGSALANLTDGTFEGTADGYKSPITVSITVEGGAITDCQIVSSAETDYCGEVALPEYAAQLIEKQDLSSIDIVAGASNTLKGFTNAVVAAISA